MESVTRGVLQFFGPRRSRIALYDFSITFGLKRYVSDAYNSFDREEWHIEVCVIAHGDATFIRGPSI